jgi:hypothetical protein
MVLLHGSFSQTQLLNQRRDLDSTANVEPGFMTAALSPKRETCPLAPPLVSRKVHHLVRSALLRVRRGFPVLAGLLRGSWPDATADRIRDRIGNGDPAGVGAAYRATRRPPTGMARNLIGLRGRRRRDGARLSAGGRLRIDSAGELDTVCLSGSARPNRRRHGAVRLDSGPHPPLPRKRGRGGGGG